MSPRKKTLLERARQEPVNRRGAQSLDDREVIDLALAYAKGEIKHGQASRALGYNDGGAVNTMGRALLRGIREGLLKVELNGKH